MSKKKRAAAWRFSNWMLQVHESYFGGGGETGKQTGIGEVHWRAFAAGSWQLANGCPFIPGGKGRDGEQAWYVHISDAMPNQIKSTERNSMNQDAANGPKNHQAET